MKTQQIENTKTFYITPATDILEDTEKYILRADLPGVKKEDLSISVENNTLEINGTVSNDNFKIGEDANAQYSYKRVFKINRDIDSEKISAHLENGILTMELTKSEALKPRKIEISSVH
jgi:HSP20 family molecular chaperone IbpA